MSCGSNDLIKQTSRRPDPVSPCCVGVCVVQVVDALSRHFVSFEGDARVMPLIWHISLLVFVQRYKHQLTTADRDALAHLTTVQHHYKVGQRRSLSVGESSYCFRHSLKVAALTDGKTS